MGSNPTWLTMTSLNKKKKGKNSYLLKANKYSNKMKRINFFNKVKGNPFKIAANKIVAELEYELLKTEE